MNLKIFAISIFILMGFSLMGQSTIWMKPNKGQWHDNIKYQIGIPGGNMYLENSGFTYYFHNAGDFIHAHNHGDEQKHHKEDDLFKGHVVRTTFLNANPQPIFKELKPSNHIENYILGNDPTKWVSNLTLYNEVNYTSLYPGINLNIYESESTLKYDIIIQPQSDVSLFKVLYQGQESITINKGNLLVKTSLSNFEESKPYAYQIINGFKHEVMCNYVLNGDTLSYDFPNGYDQSLELIIDPTIVFSTFTGSTADNWGMTACPDVTDKLIGAGIVFGSGYPTTTGAFSNSFTSGGFGSSSVDIGLTKYNDTGSGLIFSTYIGGTGSETPHSVIVNNQNQVFLMGATSSTNFPIPNSGYQSNNNGGNTRTIDGIPFVGGTDIYVIKLNPNGSAIINGTFIGGTGNDGISNPGNTGAGDNVEYNYGDHLRGEIIVDVNSNVYIASNTVSTNFPIVGGFSSSLSGPQDGVVIKLNPTLSVLNYSSYIGGGGFDTGNAIQLSNTGDIYIAGGTTSNNFPFTSGQLNSNFLGGSTDGYVMRLQAPSYGSPKATYLGTNEYDQAYLVQLDINDKVFVYGQTEGNYAVTPGKYSNANSGQFIHKLSADLSTTEWSTVFGAGTGHVELAPTAFLVSDCDEIYVAGWGGVLNTQFGNAPFSTTNGFPVTSNAYQSSTSGSNFWIGLFTPDMLALKYGTFMGSTSGVSNDHVDGGTSRFSKNGKIFHAVCASCGASTTGFPTTPGSYSPTDGSTNCNMAAFAFDLAKIDATLSVPVPKTCLPNATVFTNSSSNGNSYLWYFGDGDSSFIFQPTHLYASPGIYDVMLIVSDSNGCYSPDTAFIQVEIIEPFYDAYVLEDTICPGEETQAFAFGGTSYLWGPSILFDNPNISNPFVSFYTDTTLRVQILNACGGLVYLDIDVWVYDAIGGATEDTTICIGQFVQLEAVGGGVYEWFEDSSTTLNSYYIYNPIATPTKTTKYNVDITTIDNCLIKDSLIITVEQTVPIPILDPIVKVCKDVPKQITVDGATTYAWYPNYNIDDTTSATPFIYPDVDTTYIIGFTNSCGTTIDSIQALIQEVHAIVRPDTSVCPGEPIGLWASGGIAYKWKPLSTLNDPNSSIYYVKPYSSIYYTVTVYDDIGCFDTASFLVTVFDLPKITVSPDVIAENGDISTIWAKGNGTIEWSPPYFITCKYCNETTVFPPDNTNYTAVLTDDNGCTINDEVTIYYNPLIFVPNVFTPDGDNHNNTFKAVTHNVEKFEMTILNRWGEIVFKSYDPNGEWDGTYGNGTKCMDGVYVWYIQFTDTNGKKDNRIGNVTLVR